MRSGCRERSSEPGCAGSLYKLDQNTQFTCSISRKCLRAAIARVCDYSTVSHRALHRLAHRRLRVAWRRLRADLHRACGLRLAQRAGLHHRHPATVHAFGARACIPGMYSMTKVYAVLLAALLLVGCAHARSTAEVTAYGAAVKTAEARYADTIGVCREIPLALTCFDLALHYFDADLTQARTDVCRGDARCIALEAHQYERWAGNDKPWRKP